MNYFCRFRFLRFWLNISTYHLLYTRFCTSYTLCLSLYILIFRYSVYIILCFTIIHHTLHAGIYTPPLYIPFYVHEPTFCHSLHTTLPLSMLYSLHTLPLSIYHHHSMPHSLSLHPWFTMPPPYPILHKHDY